MSGIFGLIKFNQSPVEPEQMANMRNVMAHWGGDQQGIVTEDEVGFGQLTTFNTPESRFQQLPFKGENGQLFTAAGRIDNRQWLCDRFDIPYPDRPITPDSTLIWKAYQSWGEQAPDHLLGDWAFAVWHPQEKRLFLARDQHGNTALYYTYNQNRLAFASNHKALLALGIPQRLNENYLSQLLISWVAYHGSETIYRDIKRLPPAHTVTASRGQVNCKRYWYLEETPLLNLPTFEAYKEGFLEVYTEAVRCRLRSDRPIGSTLSGGLDSGSVTALAARELADQNKRISAFTSIPLFDTTRSVGDNRFGDETAFATATAQAFHNIDHHFIDAADISPLKGIKTMHAIRGEPGHAGGNYYWLVALFEEAQRQGLRVLLTGQGGNGTISWSGAPALHSKLNQLRVDGWKETLKATLPAPLIRTYQLSRQEKISWGNSAIHPAFAQRIDLKRRQIRAESRDRNVPYRWRTPLDQRLAILLPGRSIGGAIWAEIGAYYGIEVRDPTLDKRVMEYCLSVPDRFFIGPDQQDRWLIREGMKEILPDPVRLNQQRGRQSADIVARVRRSETEIENALQALRGSLAADYLDLAKMEALFERRDDSPSPTLAHQTRAVLLKGIDAGLILSNLFETPFRVQATQAAPLLSSSIL